MNYREKIRKAINCPQFGGNNYGKWGVLRFEQRILIKRLLDDLDNTDEYVKRLYEENQQLKIQISAREEERRKLEENWSELKTWLEKELGDRINPNKDKWLTGVYDAYKETIDKMLELERGVSE